MEWFNVLSAAVLGGSALGAALAGFFAYRRGAREKVLSALVGDLQTYNKELEDKCARLEDRVQSLEHATQLPLETLTKLIIEQHAAQMKSSELLGSHMADIATQMSNVVTSLAGSTR